MAPASQATARGFLGKGFRDRQSVVEPRRILSNIEIPPKPLGVLGAASVLTLGRNWKASSEHALSLAGRPGLLMTLVSESILFYEYIAYRKDGALQWGFGQLSWPGVETFFADQR